MKTAKLHELIQMAKDGKKFSAEHPLNKSVWNDKEFIDCETYNYKSIVMDWQYEEIREPEVVEFECEFLKEDTFGYIVPYGLDISDKIEPLVGKKWKVVCTEVIENDPT